MVTGTAHRVLSARRLARPQQPLVPQRLRHDVVVGGGRADRHVRVDAAREGLVLPARHHRLRGRRHRLLAEDRAQHPHRRRHRRRVRLGALVAPRGAPRVQREQHRLPRAALHVPELEGDAALARRARGDAPEVALALALLPEGMVEDEQHLVERPEAEALHGLQLARRQRRVEGHRAAASGGREGAARVKPLGRVGGAVRGAGRGSSAAADPALSTPSGSEQITASASSARAPPPPGRSASTRTPVAVRLTRRTTCSRRTSSDACSLRSSPPYPCGSR